MPIIQFTKESRHEAISQIFTKTGPLQRSQPLLVVTHSLYA